MKLIHKLSLNDDASITKEIYSDSIIQNSEWHDTICGGIAEKIKLF